ncbi:MAG TPA: hypothetical protein VHY35_22555 [Stellaceae bacterium]|jgi:hypothetical protein|nr:hypothetical protein [Stellaceae bacterium]
MDWRKPWSPAKKLDSAYARRRLIAPPSILLDLDEDSVGFLSIAGMTISAASGIIA